MLVKSTCELFNNINDSVSVGGLPGDYHYVGLPDDINDSVKWFLLLFLRHSSQPCIFSQSKTKSNSYTQANWLSLSLPVKTFLIVLRNQTYVLADSKLSYVPVYVQYGWGRANLMGFLPDIFT